MLVPLFAVGIRLRVPPSLSTWRPALLLAGSGMVITIALAAGVGHWLLELSLAGALLLGAILAFTDSVLACGAGDPLQCEELAHVGAVSLAYGLALALQVSPFVVAFAAGVMLMRSLEHGANDQPGQVLAKHLYDFGARVQRLVSGASEKEPGSSPTGR